MKYNTELLFIPSLMIGLIGMYNMYRLSAKVKVMDEHIDTIMSTYLKYMEVQERQCKSINDLYCKFRHNNKIEPIIFFDDESEAGV